ncbi:CRISPR-associated Csn1 family endonuclease [Salsuginibacillus halophilus]|uniref:CRISPR-associated endonuclease Cas9 n=1 Tax=Salsuginibacillus halophilus TaxID=517424 RepID=A0A2P8HL74_9BACI|nr:type II CRISPR RNA-guided endonuclease Cas9 [Salsuginibacillus halophilus]PSL46969.1 CRISPR-associated Csn1 family endonuclease [Salsuginibacillus halophilus]
MTQYTFGLDVGIASVGFGVIDENMNVVEAGVRLFPEADANENEGRRIKRGARRLQRRRKHRQERLNYLLKNYNFPVDNPSEKNPYELRVKGLSEQLTESELIAALQHLIKRRGVHNVDADDGKEDHDESSLSTKDQIKQNERLLEDKHVCEVQLERLQANGEVRGHRNRFHTKDYVREAEQLMQTQQNYHQKIDHSFIQTLIQLLEQRRAYYEGPGFGSEYGWNQDTELWFEKMMGTCTYFPEETRAVKNSYSAELFNVLNDLNNLTLTRSEETRVTEDEKEDLIQYVFLASGKPTLKKIAKRLGIREEDIRGYRVDRSGKPEFNMMEFSQRIQKVEPYLLKESVECLDQIAEILTVWQDYDNKLAKLQALELKYPETVLNKLAELNFTGTHALSLKAIHYLLPDLWGTNKNQMELFSDYGLQPKKVQLHGMKQIPHEYIHDLIISPVVKRSFIQSIRIINALRKKYGEPEEIVIELAREKNSDDQKQFLRKLQKENEAVNKQVREKLDEMGVEAKKGMFEKLRLWHYQDGHCMYSLKEIPIEDLVNNHTRYEVDHIIPRSVSFDDSQANKVLVHTGENQKKGNQTPFQYMKSGRSAITYEAFKTHVLQLAKSKEKVSKKKKEYLLEERDITKYDVQKEFINRNLVDTRYATREIMNLLQAYFKENETDVKVKSINGSVTNYLRKLWSLNKDRDIDYKHHAEDALVAAMAGYLLENHNNFQEQAAMMKEEKKVDMETGEVLNEGEFAASFTEKMEKVKQIREFPNYKYSHRIDQKPNRQLMNDTLYSTRKVEGEEYVIGKVADLYNPDNEKVKKQFDKNPESFLMYTHDPKTFEKLKVVMEQYKEFKNPLAAYHQEKETMLTKYSKKGNGPPVKSLKYYQKKLGDYKDLSHKFDSKDKRIVALSIKPFRLDMYYEGGRYKFITIRYDDLQETEDGYVIDRTDYSEKLNAKQIESDSNFLFSLYKNDIFQMDGQWYRFIGVNNDGTNRIEVDLIQKKSEKRLLPTIGKKINLIEKYHRNVLGDQFGASNEKLKFKYDK